MTMFYCPSCRQNLDAALKKNHNYMPFHKKWRDELTDRVATRVTESRFFLKNVMRTQAPEEPFTCPFCDDDTTVDQSKNKTICFALFKHLALGSHIDKTLEFINATGAPESLLYKCSLTKEEFRMYVHNSSKLLRNAAMPSAALPLEEADGVSLPQVNPTVASLAAHAPVALLPNARALPKDIDTRSGSLSGAQGGQRQSRSAPTFSNHAPRVATEYATGAGVSFIGSHTLRPGEGNIYTGAKPPWEIGDDDGELPTLPHPRPAAAAHRPEAIPVLPPSQRRGDGKSNADRRGVNTNEGGKKRDRSGRDEDGAESMWLPNFGGTFHIGSRHQWRESFRQGLASKKGAAASPSTPSEAQAQAEVLPSVNPYAPRWQSVFAATPAPVHAPVQPYIGRHHTSAPSSAPPPSSSPTRHPASPLHIPLLSPGQPALAAQFSSVITSPIAPSSVPSVPASKLALSDVLQRKRDELLARARVAEAKPT